MNNIKKYIKGEQGFSLVELLIVVVMLGIVSLSINELVIKNVARTTEERIKAQIVNEGLEFTKLIEDDFATCDKVKLYKFKNTITEIPTLYKDIAFVYTDTAYYTEQTPGIANPQGNVLVFEKDGQYFAYQLAKYKNKVVLVRFHNIPGNPSGDTDGSIEDIKILSNNVVTADENSSINSLFESGQLQRRFDITFDYNRDPDGVGIDVVAFKITLSLNNEKLDAPITREITKSKEIIHEEGGS